MDRGGEVDTFILDFEKSFDTPLHELLEYKLYGYDIGGKTLKWIYTFLCGRQQRVAVNEWSKIRFGSRFVRCHQGTVLGSLLFLLYINDITEDVDSELRLFADDCVCYREINGIEDTMKL